MIDGNFHVLMYTQNLDYNRIPRDDKKMLPNSDDEYAKRIGILNILCPKLGKQLLCMCCKKSEGYRVFFSFLKKPTLRTKRYLHFNISIVLCR